MLDAISISGPRAWGSPDRLPCQDPASGCGPKPFTTPYPAHCQGLDLDICLFWWLFALEPVIFLLVRTIPSRNFPKVASSKHCFPERFIHIVWVKVKSLSRVRLFATPWTVAYQAPPSMGFSRQECWSGLPFPSPGDLPDPGIKPESPVLQADALPSEPPCSVGFFSGLSSWFSGEKSASQAGDLGLIPGSGRSPGEGNGNPLQYSCLENLMDRGAWWATVHQGTELDTT